MSSIHDPLWHRWLAHTLHGNGVTPQPLRKAPSRPEPLDAPTSEQIEAAVRESGLPFGFPFPWM